MGDFRLGKDNFAVEHRGVHEHLRWQPNMISLHLADQHHWNAPVNVNVGVPAHEYTHRYQYVEVLIMVKLKTNEMGCMTYFRSVGLWIGLQ
ncbi:MAG: hypothetical protein IPG69_21155, partial [Flavobacteriales bacterium]|nr:hypothetical protein [Flavobacteriales bacterium]